MDLFSVSDGLNYREGGGGRGGRERRLGVLITPRDHGNNCLLKQKHLKASLQKSSH